MRLFCPVPCNNTDLNAQTNYFWLYFSFLRYKIRETCTGLPSNDRTGYSTADCRTLGWGRQKRPTEGGVNKPVSVAHLLADL